MHNQVYAVKDKILEMCGNEEDNTLLHDFLLKDISPSTGSP